MTEKLTQRPDVPEHSDTRSRGRISQLPETGATSLKDMGKVMAIVKSEGQGRCDMAAVSARLKARLSG